MTLNLGAKAPAFSLPSHHGGKVSLSGLKGKKVVIFFYPKDQTPGCTQEACDFRDNMAQLTNAEVVVLGISKDSLVSHERFAQKHELPFALLSDSDNAVAQKYGAYGEKNMYGRKVMGTIRSTFLIDESGKIAHIWSPVRVKGHVDAVLEVLAGDPSTATMKKPTTAKKKRSSAAAVGKSTKKAAARS